MSKNPLVFISYSRRDSGFVRRLVERLRAVGINTFYDEADIAVGESLVEALDQAVRRAKYLLVVMSPDYFSSTWATKELEIALNQEFEKGETKVLPLLYRDCEIPALLQSKLWADVRTDHAFEQAFPRIVEALSEKPHNVGVAADAPTKESTSLGSISKPTLDSEEIRAMIEDLKVKVEAFTAKAEPVEDVRAPSAQVDPKLCFIVMPFGVEELNDVYEYFLKPAIEDHCSLSCERGDDVFGSNVIMEDIRSSIERARLVVADLTGRNPNVFYEVGIAHTLNRDVLLLSQSMSDVPFDLRHRRVLVYDNTPKGCKKLEKTIVENIRAMLGGKA